jgi:ABC-type microcin C transport system permease subunit YejB
MTTALNLVMAAASVVVALAYVRRLAAISWATTTRRVMLVHLLGLIYCGTVFTESLAGEARFAIDGLGLGFVAAYQFWRDGPPEHSWRDSAA